MSPSPSPSPQPPSSPPTAIPTVLQPISLSPPKKPQPIPWTHEETLNLIHAYQEKWYSLKRGQLKASQWEEVAITVAARCGLDEPTKSATQCRHKIEKLRKRYRAEKLKPFTSSWVYFPLMERLELGPLPISVVAPVQSDNDDGDDEKIDGYFRNGEFGNGYRSDFGKRKFWEEKDDELDEGSQEDEKDLMGELAAQMRDFAERFVRVEKKKLEMMREAERCRMEMENKRLEMVLVSQQKTVEMISKVFGSSNKKMKMNQDLFVDGDARNNKSFQHD